MIKVTGFMKVCMATVVAGLIIGFASNVEQPEIGTVNEKRMEIYTGSELGWQGIAVRTTREAAIEKAIKQVKARQEANKK